METIGILLLEEPGAWKTKKPIRVKPLGHAVVAEGIWRWSVCWCRVAQIWLRQRAAALRYSWLKRMGSRTVLGSRLEVSVCKDQTLSP